jgi:hypothetical protein
VSDLKTCRFCGMSNYEHKHPMAKSMFIKYGPRHHAHLACLRKAFTDDALQEKLLHVPLHVINSIPYFEARDLGILPMLRSILGHELEASPVGRRANAETPQPAHESREEPQQQKKNMEKP